MSLADLVLHVGVLPSHKKAFYAAAHRAGWSNSALAVSRTGSWHSWGGPVLYGDALHVTARIADLDRGGVSLAELVASGVIVCRGTDGAYAVATDADDWDLVVYTWSDERRVTIRPS